MRFPRNSLASSVATAAIIALAASVQPATAQDPAQPPAAGQVDDQTLRVFAQTVIDIEEIVQAWTPRIEGADDAEQAEELRTEANQEIMGTIRSNGLEIETYNQIHQLAQADPNVAVTVQNYVQELR